VARGERPGTPPAPGLPPEADRPAGGVPGDQLPIAGARESS
jgi:hypothetical protein